jgi:hypothetical protein
MTFIDNIPGGPGGSFGTGTVAPGGFGAPGGTLGGPGFGGGQSKLTGTNAPGTISPFDQQAVGNAFNMNEEAMTNRYAQLGLSSVGASPTSPGGPAGGIGVGNIGKGMLPPQGGAGTPTAEQMDLGMLPSLTGGLPGEAEATLGMIQNANLQQPQSSGGGGKGGGAASALGGLGKAAMMGGK